MAITTLEQPATDATAAATKPVTPEQVAGVYWSLNEAARQVGGNKGSISRHISEGKLQWHDRPEGKRLHAAEVMHFYADRIRQRRNPVAKGANDTGLELITSKSNTPETEPQHLETAVKLATAEMEVRYLKEMLEVERQRREKAEQEQDRWHRAYDELKLLPAPAANSNTPEASPKRSLWDMITGK